MLIGFYNWFENKLNKLTIVESRVNLRENGNNLL